MKLFDPKAYHLHTQRAKKTFHTHNFLFEHVGNELVSRLQDLKKTFKKALNLSPHPLPSVIPDLETVCEFTNKYGFLDLGPRVNNAFRRNAAYSLFYDTTSDFTNKPMMYSYGINNFSWIPDRLEPLLVNSPQIPNVGMTPVCKNHHSLEEQLPYPEASFDLILSCLQGHWVNNLPGLLKSIHSSLEKDGLFLGALWGGQTLFELRESLLQAELQLTNGASPRMAPLLHPADAPHLLGRTGFFLPVVDTETITVTYPTLFMLLKDLRGMGETNKLYDRPKTFTSRLLFEKAEEIYFNTFGNPDHTLPVTFEVIYLTGWKT